MKLTQLSHAWQARCIALLSGVLISFGGAQAQQPQQFKMRIQTAVPSASIYFELLKKFGDRVDKMSAGG